MPMNRIQFQSGLSMCEFFDCYGTEAKCQAALLADSAHLTRTFRRMFGINPAALVPR